MSTYKLRRFANPETLKRVDGSNLFRLFDSFRSYFEGHGYELTDPIRDFDGLIRLIATPSAGMPEELAEALLMVDEMATESNMDALLEDNQDLFPIGRYKKLTPADVALAIFLERPEALGQRHAESFLRRQRSFEYFLAKDPSQCKDLSDEVLILGLEEQLDSWFQNNNRGRGAKLTAFRDSETVTSILIRHGGPFRREGTLNDGEPGSVIYRPELYDVLIFDAETGALKIKARTKKVCRAYLQLLGSSLFEAEGHFHTDNRLTLEPLREDLSQALVCSDVDGIDTIQLTEIYLRWDGSPEEIEIRKSSDLGAILKRPGREIPQEPKLFRAGFSVRFSRSRTTRKFSIVLPASLMLKRDSDGELIDEWLQRRGFMAGS